MVSISFKSLQVLFTNPKTLLALAAILSTKQHEKKQQQQQPKKLINLNYFLIGL